MLSSNLNFELSSFRLALMDNGQCNIAKFHTDGSWPQKGKPFQSLGSQFWLYTFQKYGPLPHNTPQPKKELQLLFIISAYPYKSFSDWIYASPQQSCQKDLLKTPAISKIKISFIVILRFLSTKRPQRCNLDTLRSWFINQTHVKKKTASLRFARDAVCFLTFLICDSISIIMKIWETLRYFWNYHYNRRLSSW